MTKNSSMLASHFAAAQAARQAGNVAAERAAWQAALQLDAQLPVAHNALGMIALAANQPDEAVQHFEHAIAADPAAPELLINLARTHRERHDDAREVAALDAAIALDQRHFMAWLRKAELHQRRNEISLAMQAWNAALSLSKSVDPMPDALAQLLARGGGWVAEQSGNFGAIIDAGLADERDAHNPRALRRFNACIDHLLGRRAIYANHCEGIHFPFLPADEYFDRDLFPWFAELEARTPAIRAELLALLANGRADLQPYVQQQPGTPRNLWSDLDGSLDWGVYFLWEYGERNEAACARCPETAAAIAAVPQIALPGRAPTAFFSILAPNKRIPPHTGVTNTRAIVHLPLIVPTGCAFRVGGETRPWVEGEAFAFDDTIEHEAWNESDELRAVLILDVWNPHITPHERQLLDRFCTVADASGFNPGMSRAR